MHATNGISSLSLKSTLLPVDTARTSIWLDVHLIQIDINLGDFHLEAVGQKLNGLPNGAIARPPWQRKQGLGSNGSYNMKKINLLKLHHYLLNTMKNQTDTIFNALQFSLNLEHASLTVIVWFSTCTFTVRSLISAGGSSLQWQTEKELKKNNKNPHTKKNNGNTFLPSAINGREQTAGKYDNGKQKRTKITVKTGHKYINLPV